METVTPTQLRGNLFKILDEVLDTGIPVEINRSGRRLRIVPVEKPDKLKNIVARPHVIKGDPGNLPDIHWEHEVNLDLP